MSGLPGEDDADTVNPGGDPFRSRYRPRYRTSTEPSLQIHARRLSGFQRRSHDPGHPGRHAPPGPPPPPDRCPGRGPEKSRGRGGVVPRGTSSGGGGNGSGDRPFHGDRGRGGPLARLPAVPDSPGPLRRRPDLALRPSRTSRDVPSPPGRGRSFLDGRAPSGHAGEHEHGRGRRGDGHDPLFPPPGLPPGGGSGGGGHPRGFSRLPEAASSRMGAGRHGPGQPRHGREAAGSAPNRDGPVAAGTGRDGSGAGPSPARRCPGGTAGAVLRASPGDFPVRAGHRAHGGDGSARAGHGHGLHGRPQGSSGGRVPPGGAPHAELRRGAGLHPATGAFPAGLGSEGGGSGRFVAGRRPGGSHGRGVGHGLDGGLRRRAEKGPPGRAAGASHQGLPAAGVPGAAGSTPRPPGRRRRSPPGPGDGPHEPAHGG